MEKGCGSFSLSLADPLDGVDLALDVWEAMALSMSASERLRELDGALHPDPAVEVYGKSLVALRNALPLIADVVEAAERETRDIGFSPDHENCPACNLTAALTALCDALEEN